MLGAIEIGMRDHEWVPIHVISQISGLPARKVEYRLGLLFEQKLVDRETIHYLGYQIGFDAYDLVALSDFVKRNRVKSIGEQIGVGKESVVYDALGELPLAIKFHRQGRTSFKHVRRLRDHLADQPKVPWLYAASLAARREFQVMEKLYPAVSIPRPVAVSRHALAMEFVYGPQLNKITLSDPEDGLEYDTGGGRKGLEPGHRSRRSERIQYNDRRCRPEAHRLASSRRGPHPHSQELLERDLSNVLRFFERKYKIIMPLEKALRLVKSKPEVSKS